jgi:hypothetical protein
MSRLGLYVGERETDVEPLVGGWRFVGRVEQERDGGLG